MISDPVVTCVVVNYNGKEDTLACLASLDTVTFPGLDVIVVDNGSTDGSVSAIRALPRAPSVLEAGDNLGFGKGANLGICEAINRGARYVWLLNNDTLVSPESLSCLVEVLEREPDVGGVASVILKMSDGSVESYGGGSVNRWLGTTQPFIEPLPRDLDYLACASALIRREAFETVGLFDEIFFAYYEDIDLSVRLQRAGWQLAVALNSTIRHKGGATTNSGRPTRSLWGDLVYVESAGAYLGKHMDALKLLGAPLRLLAMIGVRIFRRQVKRLPTVIKRFLVGFRRGYMSRSR